MTSLFRDLPSLANILNTPPYFSSRKLRAKYTEVGIFLSKLQHSVKQNFFNSYWSTNNYVIGFTFWNYLWNCVSFSVKLSGCFLKSQCLLHKYISSLIRTPSQLKQTISMECFSVLENEFKSIFTYPINIHSNTGTFVLPTWIICWNYHHFFSLWILQ